MGSPRTGSAVRLRGRCKAFLPALSLVWLLPTVGCQVEYAGMTLPSGKYMHDDVQYFQPGPDFPWANTQAATQRARMNALGMDTGPGTAGPLTIPTPPGALPAVQDRSGRFGDINSSPLGAGAGMGPETPAAPAPGPEAAPPPGGAAPPAPPPGPGGGVAPPP